MPGTSHDRRDERGPFDIIGDVHGCIGELRALVSRLGYRPDASHPEGRRLIFAGDLADRGPASLDVLLWVLERVDSGRALAVLGNHDDKLRRWLLGNPVRIADGLETTIDELEAHPETDALREDLLVGLDRIPIYLWLDDGALLVAHAGLEEARHGRMDKGTRARCLYGVTTGRIVNGLPERVDWAASYRGNPAVVYGHTPVSGPTWRNNTANVDLGCVFGGALCALRWPERTFVTVLSWRVHWPDKGPRRTLLPPLSPGAAPPQDLP